MKVKVLLATLVITLLLGVQGFASPYPCDSACVDPCGSCDSCVVKCDLFSGLKKLVSGIRVNSCDPCEPVVACNPCDEIVDCNPCDAACGSKFTLGGRLRSLFSSHGCDPCGNNECNPCDVVDDCNPCDVACRSKFSLCQLNPFRNICLGRSCTSDCNPCDALTDCNPCDDACCDTGCGPRGCLFDLPRISLKKFFGSFRCSAGCNDGCNPCDEVRPCDHCF